MADKAELFTEVIDAVDTSFSELGPRLYRIANRITGDPVAADDVLHDAYAKLLTSAADAHAHNEADVLESIRHNVLQPAFLYQVVTHQALDYFRRLKYERSVVAESGGALVGPDTDGPEAPFDQDDEEGRTTTGLAVVLDTLVARAARPDTTIGISTEQLDLLRVFYRFGNYAGHPDIDPGPTDAELDRIENNRDRTNEIARRREQGQQDRRQKGRDPNYGMNSRVAAHTGLSKSAVTRSMGRANDAVGVTLYLAGVLGKDGTLQSAEHIDAHLAVLEAWLADTDRHREVKSLRLGARSVKSRENFGTRVVPDIYLELYRTATNSTETDDALVDFLHDSEEAYSDEATVANPYPRCVLVCTPHNPPHLDRTRILEF